MFCFVFFPCFLGTGRAKHLYCSWLGQGAAGVHQMPVGIEVVPGTGRGGHGRGFCVCVRGDSSTQGEGTRTQGGWVSGVGKRDAHPVPSRLGGRAGGAPSCSDLSHATHAEAGREVGHGDEGVPDSAAVPGGCILLRPALPASPPSPAAGGATHPQAWGGGEPPEKLRREGGENKKKRERENKKPSLVISVNLEQGTASRQQASKAVRKPQIPTP